jgi:hypothetical protein
VRPAHLALAPLLALSTALLAPLAARGEAAQGTPAAEAAKAYSLEAAAAPASLKVGGKGVLTLAIVTAKGAHVDPRAPLKVTLSASAGLALAKTALGHDDQAGGKDEPPRFEVPFTAGAAGAQEARAKVDFFICTDKACVKQVREIGIPVDVK